MKKFIATFLFMLLLSPVMLKGQAALLVLIFGEKAATENFHFSLKLGASYNVIHGYEDGQNRFSLQFGLTNNIRLSDRLTLVPEFLPLSSRAIKNVPVLTTGNPDLDDLLIEVESTDRKISYIDIPVLLKVRLSDRFSVSAGPSVSFRTAATDMYKSVPLEGIVLKSELDILEGTSPVDVGGAIDLEYILVPPKGGKGINLYLRYSKGFMNLVKESSGNKYTASMIQFGATFPFVKE